MALLNRLFSSRRKPFARAQDNASDKLFTFTNDQVRVIVFRECDFRGRKLLFDSKTVRREILDESQEADPEHPKKYAEVTNGHVYSYEKPCSDVSRLGEMIFGSVAMSFRGTTYKIHSVPSQLICSQVFPSPKNPARMRRSAPSHVNTGSSIEHSIRLDDSGASSATSGSDQSVLSGASDTVLVCKRQHSIPLDVPANFSLVSSSGYGEEHSYSSVSSGPQSIPVDLSQGVHSGDSLGKRWPGWSMSGSMDPSTSSLPGSASTEESFHKVRSSKIGLAVLIELTDGEEDKIEQFLMEHAALIEMMMWRVRRGVEGAYIRHNTFVSVMYTISTHTAHWLVDLLTGTRNLVQTWHSHFPNCDNLFSIINKSPSVSFLGHLTGGSPRKTPLHTDNRDAIRFSTLASSAGFFSSFKSESCVFDGSGEFNFSNFSKFLKHESASGKKDEGLILAEKFVKEFCELLESVDEKHTNFFISTLVTAVLTHHLGWVNTVLPVALKQNQQQSSNPFWSQLTELYGAIGYPMKMSRTVVSGSQKTDLVPKILNALKYFIRCTEVSRNHQARIGVDFENANADSICAAKSCIPKENYKKYEDHLREIEEFTKAESQQQILKLKMPNKREKQETVLKISNNNGDFIKPPKKLNLVKTHTCLNELDKLCETQEKHTEILDKVTNLGLQAYNPDNEIDVACSFLQNIDKQQLVDINEAKQQIERVFSPKKKSAQKSFLKIPDESENEKNVVFVLGDDEKLVGIKREVTPTKLTFKDTESFESSIEIAPTVKRCDFLSQYLDHNSNQQLQTMNVSNDDIFKVGMKKSKTFGKEMNVIPAESLQNSLDLNKAIDLKLPPPDEICFEKKQIVKTKENSDEVLKQFELIKDENDFSLEANDFPKSGNKAEVGLKKSKTICKELNINQEMFESKSDFQKCNDETDAVVSAGLKKSKTISKELNLSRDIFKFPDAESCIDETDATFSVELKESIDAFKNPPEFKRENVESNISVNKTPVGFQKSETVYGDSYAEELELKENVDRIKNVDYSIGISTNFVEIPIETKFIKNSSNLESKSLRNVSTDLIIENKKCGLKKSKTVGKELNISSGFKVKSLTDLSENTPFTLCSLDEVQFLKHQKITNFTSDSVSGKELNKTEAAIPIISKYSPESAFVDTSIGVDVGSELFNKPIVNTQTSEASGIHDLSSRNNNNLSGRVNRTSKKFKKIKKKQIGSNSMGYKNIKASTNLRTNQTSDLLSEQSLESTNDAFNLQQVASFSTFLEPVQNETTSCFHEIFDKEENKNLHEEIDTAPFKDSDFTQCLPAGCIKPSSSYSEIQSMLIKSKSKRATSEPPNSEKQSPSTSTKYKYSGVKFNFQQYPQIVENYMKNKNIELSNMQFSEKKLDFRWQSSRTFDFSNCEAGEDFDGVEALTTPSNASELEFTSELVVDKAEGRRAEEVLVDQPGKRLVFTRNVVPNTVIKEPNPYEQTKLLKDVKNRRISEERMFSNLKVVELPMPRSKDVESHFPLIDYTNSLIRGLEDHYISDMVLQGTTAPKNNWEQNLKKDLLLSTQQTFSNQQVEESIAIVANTDTWEVQLMSSHTYVIDRSSAGVPVGMSQLVANMLETLLHMWRLHTPAEYCLMHIEQQLHEFCLRSKALAQFLLDTDFCSMEILTSALRLEVNDVPLLMAIASTHTPQVTQKYGLSFQ